MGNNPYRGTEVPVAKSKESIEKLLRGHGVSATRFTSLPAMAVLEFVTQKQVNGRPLNIPYRFEFTPELSVDSSTRAINAAERQVWRVVYWWLKGKFEAIDFGLIEQETEFLPYMLIQGDSGQVNTVSKMLGERLAGRLGADSDPFGGLKVLPAPEGK